MTKPGFSFFGFVLLYVSLVSVVFLTPSPGFHFVFSVLAKSLAGKSVSEMTYFVSSGTYNFAQCQCNKYNSIFLSVAAFLLDLDLLISACSA